MQYTKAMETGNEAKLDVRQVFWRNTCICIGCTVKNTDLQGFMHAAFQH